jgi:glucose/arabinose dehydrogenase
VALRLALFLSTSAALLLGIAMPAAAATYPPGFGERVMVSGLTRPMDVAWAPDGRMFVIQKDGQLLVVPPGSSRARVVADLSYQVNGQLERGLLGLAVDAHFAENGYVYLLFTFDIDPPAAGERESPGPMVSQLRRVEVDPANRVVSSTPILGTDTSGVCPAPANEVDCIPSDGTTHSIGTVRADPDGTLWVGSGDGYSEEAEFPARAYDQESMAGKIMHIDRDGNGLPGHPFCPGETNLDLVCTKIHAQGFRNPFRFTLRPGGGLVVGDVGWTTREELNLVDAVGGGNYGWPCREGKLATPNYTTLCSGLTLPEPVIDPVYDYPHLGSQSIVGGPTYTGSGYPTAYRNSIFFGDFAAGFIRRLVPNRAGGFRARRFATDWRGVALELAPNGALVSVNPDDFGARSGTITRIRYSADVHGPRLRLLSVQPFRGLISGRARDSSGVRRVMVAVRRKPPRGGCSWWLRGRRRMSTGRRRCDRPRWMNAELERISSGVRWKVRLAGKLPPGRFRVLVDAADRRGNVSRLPRKRASLVRVRKR